MWLAIVGGVTGLATTFWNLRERYREATYRPARYVTASTHLRTASTNNRGRHAVTIRNDGPEPVVIEWARLGEGPLMPPWASSWHDYLRRTHDEIIWTSGDPWVDAQLEQETTFAERNDQAALAPPVVLAPGQLIRGVNADHVTTMRSAPGERIEGHHGHESVEIYFRDFNGRRWARCDHVLKRLRNFEPGSLRDRRLLWIEEQHPKLFLLISVTLARRATLRTSRRANRRPSRLAYIVDGITGWREGTLPLPFPSNAPRGWTFDGLALTDQQLATWEGEALDQARPSPAAPPDDQHRPRSA